MKVTKKHIIIAYSMIICVLIGALGVYLPNKNGIELSKKIDKAYAIDEYLKENGVPSKEIKKNDEDFINKYLELKYDKYTYYHEGNNYSREDMVEFINSLPTSIGSGFSLYLDNEKFIFSVKSDSWAENQGLKSGDEIIFIDGFSIADNYENVKKLAGKQDTICEITIIRNGNEHIVSFIRNNSMEELSTSSFKMIGNVLYLKIDKIGDNTSGEVKNILNSNDFNSIIIDLRGNKGGHTYVATDIADYFLSDGYTTEHYYLEEEKYTVYMKKEETDIKVPIVLIVNENTASAAETITALLKQNSNTTIIGTKTFGKGIFQSSASIMGGLLHYTDGYFTVGDWKCWQGVGIAPDIEIEMKYDEDIIGTEEDIQLQKALEILKQ